MPLAMPKFLKDRVRTSLIEFLGPHCYLQWICEQEDDNGDYHRIGTGAFVHCEYKITKETNIEFRKEMPPYGDQKIWGIRVYNSSKNYFAQMEFYHLDVDGKTKPVLVSTSLEWVST